MNKIQIFKEVKKFLFENKFEYEITLNNNYVRVGYWERAEDKLEDYLFSLGFKLCADYDEDTGVLFSYCLPSEYNNETYILLDTETDDVIEAVLYDDDTFLGFDGMFYPVSRMVVYEK